MNNDKLIKVNLPRKYDDFVSGNGEGVWVEVDCSVLDSYNQNLFGGSYKGQLQNDSVYYPSLKCGSTIKFELRGEGRPVADIQYLSNFKCISDDEFNSIVEKILKRS